jgi:hypothetical protein
LAADPAAHIDVPVSGTGPGWIHIQADSCPAFFTVPAASARNIERYGNEVTLFYELDITAGFNHLAGNLVAQNQAGGRSGTAPDHMLIAAANIGRDNLKNYAVFAFPISQRKLREIN